MHHNVVGLDIAKNVFHFYSLGPGHKVIKKKLKRADLLAFFANYPTSMIGMEACGGARHWARELTKLGRHVVLLNARFVKSFVVGNKNDFNEAQAIYDAVNRPNKRVVAVKTIEQQDIQLVHKVRQGYVDQRINRLCQSNELAVRFLEVPGVGAITATIMAADIGNGKGYESGRDYAASLGIVPKQHSSGDKLI